ncbi:hypothetical protein [Halosolutus halophilus]|uniref:hypothetical protein n=1 Tax=Halosolutus halophilus TaxID=1552990 RepID=UPI0022352B12|nr:hypothetical protein [Halosolutus halophilus]
MLALTSNTTIRWENDDVDLVTDGGRVQDRASIENHSSIKSRLEEIDQLTRSLLEDVQDDEDLAEPTRKAGERYLRGIRAQTESAMTVLVGPEAAFDDWPDDDHDDSAPVATTDGGQPIHRATCEDCAWSFENKDLVDVSDEMERHARKEMHDVDLERAVATDGGYDATDRARALTDSIVEAQRRGAPAEIVDELEWKRQRVRKRAETRQHSRGETA